MPLLTRVRQLLGEPDVVYECRQCGTTLDPKPDGCRSCGADDVARYVIE